MACGLGTRGTSYIQTVALLFGIDDETHQVVGPDFAPHTTKKDNEELES